MKTIDTNSQLVVKYGGFFARLSEDLKGELL